MKINVNPYFIYSANILFLRTQFQSVVFSHIYIYIYVDIRQYVVTLLYLCFHLRKYIYSTEIQDPADEIYHMLAASLWSTLLPQATSRLRQDDSLPVPSDDFLRHRLNNHLFKGRLRAPCSPITTILLMSQQSLRYLTAGTTNTQT